MLDEARALAADARTLIEVDRLAGHIATLRGPVMDGHAILTAAAAQADPDSAVAMLAEAASACFYAGNPAEMLAVAEKARAGLPADSSVRARFLATMALGMARIFGGDAASGARRCAGGHAGRKLGRSARRSAPAALAGRGTVVPPPRRAGRSLLDHALQTARSRAAVGVLPFALNLIARDQATTDRWAVADSTYREAIDLARESGQHTELAFGLAGLAWLHARRGREEKGRARRPRLSNCAREWACDCTRSGPRRPWASSSSA